MNGIAIINAERARQITEEGFTTAHDDQHDEGELAQAAISYSNLAATQIKVLKACRCKQCTTVKVPTCFIPKSWPWERQWWKPSDDPIKNLVKAGALYQAEAGRLRRYGDNDYVMAEERVIDCANLIDLLALFFGDRRGGTHS